jgi:amino acid efflux transporter
MSVTEPKRLNSIDAPADTGAKRLEKTLSLPVAVGLAITVVVGSGLLALPGLAYEVAGAAAVYGWLIAAVISIPFLIVFAYLGARIPGAGGIAGFVQVAFSRRVSIVVEFLLLGTFAVGGPAMVITGANYFAAAAGVNIASTLIGSIITLLFAGTINYLGARISGRLQQLLAIALVILLGGVAAVALIFGDRSVGTGIAPISRWMEGIPAVSLVFFAFVGWEMMSFISEEFRSPRRDFPLMIAISFVVVTGLYLLIAVVVQQVLPVNDRQIVNTPIASLLGIAMGEASGRLIALIGFLILLTNLTSGSWAASRLVFSSSREGLLPTLLSRVDHSSGTPRYAVIATVLSYVPALLLYAAGWVSQALLFQFAGASFFVLYAFSVAAFIKLQERKAGRVFGVGVLLFVGLIMFTFGGLLVFPLLLLAIGSLWSMGHSKSTLQGGFRHSNES